MSLLAKAQVTAHDEGGNGFWRMTLRSPDLVALAHPGQFVHLRISGSSDPLLRRPMSIHQINSKEGWLRILYQVVGRGTEMLSRIKVGESVDILGPLGQGFPMPKAGEKVGLVAGGMGVAPLLALSEELVRAGHQLYLFQGARDARGLLLQRRFQDLGVAVLPCTEDGSLGWKGRVTERLAAELSGLQLGVLYACGPTPMLKAVQTIALEKEVAAWLSLEAHMACGLGACLGCTVRVRQGQEWVYRLLCQDGPVLSAEEVVFGE